MDEKNKLTTTTAKGNINHANLTINEASVVLNVINQNNPEAVKPKKRVFRYTHTFNGYMYIVKDTDGIWARCMVLGDFWWIMACHPKGPEQVVCFGSNASEELELVKIEKQE